MASWARGTLGVYECVGCGPWPARAFPRIFIATPIIVIGIVTFLLSFLGVFAGNRFGKFFGKRKKTVSGLILIGIGLRILLEHLA